jgi:uncharacterized protein YoaH (UPF0181 family)
MTTEEELKVDTSSGKALKQFAEEMRQEGRQEALKEFDKIKKLVEVSTL